MITIGDMHDIHVVIPKMPTPFENAECVGSGFALSTRGYHQSDTEFQVYTRFPNDPILYDDLNVFWNSDFTKCLDCYFGERKGELVVSVNNKDGSSQTIDDVVSFDRSPHLKSVCHDRPLAVVVNSIIEAASVQAYIEHRHGLSLLDFDIQSLNKLESDSQKASDRIYVIPGSFDHASEAENRYTSILSRIDRDSKMLKTLSTHLCAVCKGSFNKDTHVCNESSHWKCGATSAGLINYLNAVKTPLIGLLHDERNMLQDSLEAERLLIEKLNLEKGETLSEYFVQKKKKLEEGRTVRKIKKDAQTETEAHDDSNSFPQSVFDDSLFVDPKMLLGFVLDGTASIHVKKSEYLEKLYDESLWRNILDNGHALKSPKGDLMMKLIENLVTNPEYNVCISDSSKDRIVDLITKIDRPFESHRLFKNDLNVDHIRLIKDTDTCGEAFKKHFEFNSIDDESDLSPEVSANMDEILREMESVKYKEDDLLNVGLKGFTMFRDHESYETMPEYKDEVKYLLKKQSDKINYEHKFLLVNGIPDFTKQFGPLHEDNKNKHLNSIADRLQLLNEDFEWRQTRECAISNYEIRNPIDFDENVMSLNLKKHGKAVIPFDDISGISKSFFSHHLKLEFEHKVLAYNTILSVSPHLRQYIRLVFPGKRYDSLFTFRRSARQIAKDIIADENVKNKEKGTEYLARVISRLPRNLKVRNAFGNMVSDMSVKIITDTVLSKESKHEWQVPSSESIFYPLQSIGPHHFPDIRTYDKEFRNEVSFFSNERLFKSKCTADSQALSKILSQSAYQILALLKENLIPILVLPFVVVNQNRNKNSPRDLLLDGPKANIIMRPETVKLFSYTKPISKKTYDGMMTDFSKIIEYTEDAMEPVIRAACFACGGVITEKTSSHNSKLVTECVLQTERTCSEEAYKFMKKITNRFYNEKSYFAGNPFFKNPPISSDEFSSIRDESLDLNNPELGTLDDKHSILSRISSYKDFIKPAQVIRREIPRYSYAIEDSFIEETVKNNVQSQFFRARLMIVNILSDVQRHIEDNCLRQIPFDGTKKYKENTILVQTINPKASDIHSISKNSPEYSILLKRLDNEATFMDQLMNRPLLNPPLQHSPKCTQNSDSFSQRFEVEKQKLLTELSEFVEDSKDKRRPLVKIRALTKNVIDSVKNGMKFIFNFIKSIYTFNANSISTSATSTEADMIASEKSNNPRLVISADGDLSLTMDSFLSDESIDLDLEESLLLLKEVDFANPESVLSLLSPDMEKDKKQDETKKNFEDMFGFSSGAQAFINERAERRKSVNPFFA